VIETKPVVYVVDDDSAVREALDSLIRSAGFGVETFVGAKDFLHSKLSGIPGCLVLDVQLPGLSGLDLQRELTLAKIDLPIIFITGHGDIPMSVRAMKAGAIEFLTKPFRDRDLLEAIQSAVERDRVSRQRRSQLNELRQCFQSLTRRERDVMKLVVKGLLNKQIAGDLGTSEVTVKQQRGQVMHKMKVGSLAELVTMAARLNVETT
jgi:RNA polymerase sigma factor (sigma-70 family)